MESQIFWQPDIPGFKGKLLNAWRETLDVYAVSLTPRSVEEFERRSSTTGRCSKGRDAPRRRRYPRNASKKMPSEPNCSASIELIEGISPWKHQSGIEAESCSQHEGVCTMIVVANTCTNQN